MSKNQEIYNNIYMGSKNTCIGPDCGRLIAYEILCKDQLKQPKIFKCKAPWKVEPKIRKQTEALSGRDLSKFWFREYIRYEAIWAEEDRIAYVEFRGIF
jgi:hypothetical protein